MPAIENFKNVKSVTQGLIEKEILAELVNQGKKDAEIAAYLGVNRTTVVKARKRYGLKDNHALDTEKLKNLHSQGKTDAEIAEEIGVNRTTVVKLRKQLGLIANRKKGRPATKKRVVITEQVEKNVLRMLNLGYSPAKAAARHGITKKEVLDIYMKHQPRTWLDLYMKLDNGQLQIFEEWRIRVTSIVNREVVLFDVGMIKDKIKIIKEKIKELPPEEKGGLPTPEVMARMGVRNAYMVDLAQDAEYVGLRHIIRLLEEQMEKKYWEEIRKSMDEMASEILEVAEGYLEEEVYIPFFAAEFHGIMPAVCKNTIKYNDMTGINLDDSYGGKLNKEVREIMEQDRFISTTGTTQRRRKGGGRRKSMDEICFI